MTHIHTGVKTLFIDLDDTLWENNLFFEMAQQWFESVGRRCGHTNRATRTVLDRLEEKRIKWKGYGYDSYEESLVQAIRAIVHHSGATIHHAGIHHTARNWANFLRSHPIHWREGVLETIPKLGRHYQLIVVTKGNEKDQMGKVHRSGKEHLFDAIEVVPHKQPGNYLGLLNKYDLDPSETVMVGNSPRSDINCARLAGLRTVYIPHPSTWSHEMEPIKPDPPLTIEIPVFSRLPSVVSPRV
jgi:putative hydrolase of the HAD superfamily